MYKRTFASCGDACIKCIRLITHEYGSWFFHYTLVFTVLKHKVVSCTYIRILHLCLYSVVSFLFLQRTHDNYDSCCCWCTCLYLVLLTFVVAVLGVFCGYLMYNVWQIDGDTGAAHKDLRNSIEAMQRRKLSWNSVGINNGTWKLWKQLVRSYDY